LLILKEDIDDRTPRRSSSFFAQEASAPVQHMDADRVRLLKFKDQDPEEAAWQKHKKHVFILSSAGKPIFTRYGDEEKLAPFMALLATVRVGRGGGGRVEKVAARGGEGLRREGLMRA
jgi:hypothetical protein